MAADCRPRQMPRPACASETRSRQNYRCLLWQYSARTWGSRLHIRSRGLMRGKYNYGHALASAHWTASSSPQCRTHPIIAPQTAPAAGLSRPHDVRQRVVRGQAVGFPRCPRERVGMRLAATSRTRLTRNECIQRAGSSPRIKPVRRGLRVGMLMAGQLCFRERGLADSAGQTFLIAAMRHNQELFHASSYRSSR